MGGKVILLFLTTHETLLAEKTLKDEGIRVRPRIKPRKITSQCGIGLEIDKGGLPHVLALCENAGYSVVGLFREIPGKGWEGIEGP